MTCYSIGAALAGGAINSVAGGGTLLTFPALQAVLGSSAAMIRIANYTSTVALMPGSLAGAWGYRRELSQNRRWIALLAAPSLLGGIVGSLLLTELPAETFAGLVPWLILTAAALFALQPRLARWLGIGKPHAEPNARHGYWNCSCFNSSWRFTAATSAPALAS